jgi:hypothetical protein
MHVCCCMQSDHAVPSMAGLKHARGLPGMQALLDTVWVQGTHCCTVLAIDCSSAVCDTCIAHDAPLLQCQELVPFSCRFSTVSWPVLFLASCASACIYEAREELSVLSKLLII